MGGLLCIGCSCGLVGGVMAKWAGLWHLWAWLW